MLGILSQRPAINSHIQQHYQNVLPKTERQREREREPYTKEMSLGSLYLPSPFTLFSRLNGGKRSWGKLQETIRN
jgi:hypothetical protein